MSSSVKGYAGEYLRVDMSNGSLTDVAFDEETLRTFLGGTGIGAKVLYEEVPPETGVPLPETVESLGLGHLVDDLKDI
ncbi:MAG: hypothetical protein NWE88_05110 [Candidatus Bathyarchaeota archaeon]|nr:hypothetical protein [Candidatus Bathyarchaeota archaeon]